MPNSEANKAKVHNDDISQILILNKKSISNYENQLFQSELEKFRPHQNRLLQANHKQSALMKELTASFNSLLQDKRVRSEQSKYESIQRQRASVVNRYKRAYQEFLELESGLQSAKRWYVEMKETVDSLEKNVDTFVNNRRSEGAQLLDQIEQERAANKSAHAEVERERLQTLMARMSMDPNSNGSTPPPKPPSARPVPTPLNFNSTPSYPQTNFSGQYQIPRSPPPNQGSYHHSGYSSPPPGSTFSGGAMHQQQSYTPVQQQQQSAPFGQTAAYNPSNWGRNPGPTSPPPTQTSFGGIGHHHQQSSGGRAGGPVSPPPTQTSFQYNTYGNPQAMQQQPATSQPMQQQPQQPGQQYMPIGFVPPPPPPGPPPLGPQQTYHYPPHQHQQQQQMSPQQQQQGQNDPWAGLSAWR